MTAQDFIAAIERVLLDPKAERIIVNPKDYVAHVMALPRKRFEPNTELQLIKMGWMGTYGLLEEQPPDRFVPPKPIYCNRSIPEGIVLGE